MWANASGRGVEPISEAAAWLRGEGKARRRGLEAIFNP